MTGTVGSTATSEQAMAEPFWAELVLIVCCPTIQRNAASLGCFPEEKPGKAD